MRNNFDIIIVGGGIAGFGIAAFLGKNVRALLLEKEAFPGVHATGRSAALFSETYGSEPIRALSRAGRTSFPVRPRHFSSRRRFTHAAVSTSPPKTRSRNSSSTASSSLMKAAAQIVTGTQAIERCPLLRPGYATAALWEPGAHDVDVDSLLAGVCPQVPVLGWSDRNKRGSHGGCARNRWLESSRR